MGYQQLLFKAHFANRNQLTFCGFEVTDVSKPC